MSNEPIKTAMTAKELMLEHRKADPTSPLHWITVKHAVLAAEDYASQQTAELQRENERLRPLLSYFVGRLQTTGVELNSFDKAMIERAEQALKDK